MEGEEGKITVPAPVYLIDHPKGRNLRASLDRMHLPKRVHDREQSLATLAHLRDLRDDGARIFFGHDPEFWAGMPQAQSLKSLAAAPRPSPSS